MISGTPNEDEYSFFLEDDMLTKSSKKKCQVRCQLLALIRSGDITKHNIGKVKKPYIGQIIDNIKKTVF